MMRSVEINDDVGKEKYSKLANLIQDRSSELNLLIIIRRGMRVERGRLSFLACMEESARGGHAGGGKMVYR